MLNKEAKAEIVRKYASDPKNTGDSSVQIGLLSKRIDVIAEHLKSHQEDHSSRRGLLIMVGQRRSLLRYLRQTDSQAYKKVCSDFNLR